jgi:hypothetical protein
MGNCEEIAVFQTRQRDRGKWRENCLLCMLMTTKGKRKYEGSSLQLLADFASEGKRNSCHPKTLDPVSVEKIEFPLAEA